MRESYIGAFKVAFFDKKKCNYIIRDSEISYYLRKILLARNLTGGYIEGGARQKRNRNERRGRYRIEGRRLWARCLPFWPKIKYKGQTLSLLARYNWQQKPESPSMHSTSTIGVAWLRLAIRQKPSDIFLPVTSLLRMEKNYRPTDRWDNFLPSVEIIYQTIYPATRYKKKKIIYDTFWHIDRKV